MSEYSKSFLREDTRKEAGPKVWLGAFGKHPGWNDHVEDLGLETQSLILAKSVLYAQGIGGQIDSGAWEKLDPSQQMPGFNHVFLWRRGNQILLGKMWSSSDGKGRTRYPMIVCAQCAGVSVGWAVKNILPQLEDIQRKCQATDSAETVRSLLARGLSDLRSRLPNITQTSASGSGLPLAERKAFVDSAALGPDRQGLFRIVHQIESQMGTYAGDPSATKTSDLRPQQIRLPRAADSAAQSLLAWDQVFQILLLPGAPLLFVLSLDNPWVDVTVGEPGTHEFFSLRANDKNIPLASAIPYNVGEGTKVRAQQLVEALLSDSPKKLPDPPAPPKAGPLSGLTGFFSRAKSKWLVMMVAVMALIVVVFVFRPSRPPAVVAPAPSSRDDKAKGDTEAKIQQQEEKDRLAAEARAKAQAEADAKAKAEQEKIAAREKQEAQEKAAEEARLKAQHDKALAEAKAQAEAELKASEEASRKAEEQAAAEEKAKAEVRSRLLAEENLRKKADEEAQAEKARQAALEKARQEQLAKAEADRKTEQEALAKAESEKIAIAAKAVEPAPVPAPAPVQPLPVAGQQPDPNVASWTNSAGVAFVWAKAGILGVGVYEVTQGQYFNVMHNNPSAYKNGPSSLPVEFVSGMDAMKFCSTLTDREHASGSLGGNWKYSLPTDTQWKQFTNNTPIESAIITTSVPRTHPEPVGENRTPNALGLYDVFGNVAELCLGEGGQPNLIAGGHYKSHTYSFKYLHFIPTEPGSPDPTVGFRIVLEPIQ